jgi:hypothetical protein
MSYTAQILTVIALSASVTYGLLPLLLNLRLWKLRRDERRFINDMQNRKSRA